MFGAVLQDQGAGVDGGGSKTNQAGVAPSVEAAQGEEGTLSVRKQCADLAVLPLLLGDRGPPGLGALYRCRTRQRMVGLRLGLR